jgi:hypothetical protein
MCAMQERRVQRFTYVHTSFARLPSTTVTTRLIGNVLRRYLSMDSADSLAISQCQARRKSIIYITTRARLHMDTIKPSIDDLQSMTVVDKKKSAGIRIAVDRGAYSGLSELMPRWYFLRCLCYLSTPSTSHCQGLVGRSGL